MEEKDLDEKTNCVSPEPQEETLTDISSEAASQKMAAPTGVTPSKVTSEGSQSDIVSQTVEIQPEMATKMDSSNEVTPPKMDAPNEATQPDVITLNERNQQENTVSSEGAQQETVAPNEATQANTEEKDASEQILKQPWLNEDERFQGKERFVDLSLYNAENCTQKLRFDRKEIEKSTIHIGEEEANWSKYGFIKSINLYFTLFSMVFMHQQLGILRKSNFAPTDIERILFCTLDFCKKVSCIYDCFLVNAVHF